jgi:protein pelota
VHLDRIATCCDISRKADIAAVVLQEGLAQICLLTENMTVVKLRVESNVPKKRRGTTTDHDKGLVKFFDQVYQGICQHINFELIKVFNLINKGLDNRITWILQGCLVQVYYR